MTLLLYRLGRASVRRRRVVALAWAVIALVSVVLGQVAGGETSDSFDVPDTEAQQALDVLEEDFPAAAGTSAQLVFEARGASLADPGPAAAVEAALADVTAQPDVGEVGELQLAPEDPAIGLVDVQYDVPSEGIRDEAFARLEATAEAASATGDVRLELGGDLPSEAVQEEPGGQEAVGFLVAIVVLLVAFGSVIAMGLPIGLALAGLVTTAGLTALVAAVLDVNSVAPILATMIGAGVGIDYALFIVTRHREHLAAGMTVEESAGRALATSGAAVLFAGTTVVIAIMGLAIAGIPAVTVMALVTAGAVAIMVALALTLLPALLGFAGHRIDAVRLPGMRPRTGVAGPGAGPGGTARETAWHRWGRQVSAHPWRYLTVGVVVLGLLAAPMASLRLGMTDNGTASEDLTTRQAYDLLAEGFGVGFNGPLVLSAELGDGATVADLAALEAALADDPGVAQVDPAVPNEDGTAAVLRAVPTTSPQDEATVDTIHRLRADVIPAALDRAPATEVHIGGQTAMFIDMSERIEGRLPWFIGAVLLLSVVLLTAVFRSVVVPIKAAIMNLLSIGAAYGVIVAVFQWGWGNELFGVEQTIPIVSFVPMMLFAILFGLSMDYEVFLLSRVREEYLHRGDNEAAVVEGIAATARVITSAALIMISVFAAFVLGVDPVIKMFGLGLSTAVFIDATIVRVVLVPATMRLLGDRNWWLPRWLDRRLPNLDIEGGVGLPAPEYEPRPQPAPAEEREPALV